MESINHLQIDETLKLKLQQNLKEFRKHKRSITTKDNSVKNSPSVSNVNKNKENFIDILFKEYDSISDMAKGFTNHFSKNRKTTI